MPLAGVTQQNLQPIIDALAAHTQSTSIRTGAQVSADAQGLIAQSSRDFNNTILPNITRASENAGASGGALTALLAQNAASAQAAKVGTLQANQLSINDQLRVSDQANKGNELSNLLNTLQGANTASANRQAHSADIVAQLTAQATQAGLDRTNQLSIAQGNQGTQLQIAQGNNATTIAEGGANRQSAASIQAADLSAQLTRLVSAQQFTSGQNAADRTATATNATQAQQATMDRLVAQLQSMATQGNLDRTAQAGNIQAQLASALQISQGNNANRLDLQANDIAQQTIQATADRQLKTTLTKMGLDSTTINNILTLQNATNMNNANNATSRANTASTNAAGNYQAGLTANASIQSARLKSNASTRNAQIAANSSRASSSSPAANLKTHILNFKP